MKVDPARDSLFTRARNLERALGLGRVYLKFEGSNPTGTQKDRIAQAAYEDAHGKGHDTITLATCGNFGAAIAYACSANGIRPVIFIPTRYHTPRVAEMQKWGGRIVRVPGDYEAAVAASNEAARANGWYDANPGASDQWELSRRAYAPIGREIVDALGGIPDTVSVSVGNGTTLAGVHAGIEEVMLGESLTDSPNGVGGTRERPAMPRFIAASTPRGNPIVHSFKRGLTTCQDLDPASLRETDVNEPLINWHSFDGDRALAALRGTNGFAEYASDRDMKRAAALIRDHEGVSVLTASAAALAAFEKTARANPDAVDWQNGTHVVVLTGRSMPKARHVKGFALAGTPAAPAAPFVGIGSARAPGLASPVHAETGGA